MPSSCISPITPSFSSSSTNNFLSSVPMYIGCSAHAVWVETNEHTPIANAAAGKSFIVAPVRLRKYDIDFAPIISGGGALVCPIHCVIQVIRHLGRPAAAEVAIEEVALNGL